MCFERVKFFFRPNNLQLYGCIPEVFRCRSLFIAGSTAEEASEFTPLIVLQRFYSAFTRIVSEGAHHGTRFPLLSAWHLTAFPYVVCMTACDDPRDTSIQLLFAAAVTQTIYRKRNQFQFLSLNIFDKLQYFVRLRNTDLINARFHSVNFGGIMKPANAKHIADNVSESLALFPENRGISELGINE
jgi:hypothetical protein